MLLVTIYILQRYGSDAFVHPIQTWFKINVMQFQSINCGLKTYNIIDILPQII